MEEFYYDKLFIPLSGKLGFDIPKNWKEQNHIVDEILQAKFHQFKLPFELTQEEVRLLHKFIRDDFYRRRFGDLNIALYASSELRKYIAS